MSQKFTFNKDFILLDEIIFNKDEKVELTDGKLSFKSINGIEVTLTYDNIKDYLDIIKDENFFQIDYDDETIKTYRFQIDITSTERKAREIESILRNKIKDLI